MDRLSQSKGMKNMVSFYMSNDQRHEGQVLFGGMDTTKFVEPITYMPLNSKSFWQFDWSTSTFSVGNVAKNVGLAGSLKDVISDTGKKLYPITRILIMYCRNKFDYSRHQGR